MTFVNYQNSNNANTLLIADISASATTLLITEGEQNLFPSQFPFLLTIEHLDTDGNVVLREIVKAISGNQNSFSVVRGFGMCVQDDTASNRVQDNTTHAFSSGDRVSLYRTSEQVKDIQNKLETSANDSAVADEYSSSSTYAEGDIVMYKGDRYICTTAVETAEAFDSTKRTKKSVQLDVSQMQSDIFALQNSNFASDHLEEKGIVGELYSLSDKIYKQYTPILSNSTVDCKVGDVANNTQIHIQRMGSGTASNQLKLKVKKIGSPTTGLVVEVRRGVEVDVSSSEAYRYGGELIASGSIAYGDITTSYSEITVSLNNEFGGTVGELLDVVVYQTLNVVNASNYYCVACDSTQYSEAFSYVSVNGNTRVRSKFMPYCISDGFLQSLLCKVADPLSEVISNIYSSSEITCSNYSGTDQVGDFGTATINTAGYYQVDLDITQDRTRYTSFWTYFGGIDGPFVIRASSGGARKLSKIIYLSAGTKTVSYRYNYTGEGTGGGSYYFKAKALINTANVYFKDGINGIPLTLEGLGNEIGINIFGIYENEFYKNKFFDDFVKVLGSGTSVTTGSITLGNCVGFLTIKNGDNEYKIPYYK